MYQVALRRLCQSGSRRPRGGRQHPSIAGIAAGYHFGVVLGADGAVCGWGADDTGQLDNAPTPTPVTRPMRMTGTASGITQLSAGFDHVLALKSNGTVLAWGDNSAGELGDGSTAGVTGAIQVLGLAGVS
jgi:alpha-tubulin suppressor-like RCC1 family protein